MIVLITGGSGSGKSEFAENKTLSLNNDNLIYIATMIPYNEESLMKIDRHKKLRENKNFSTYECFTNLKEINIPNNSTVLLDCISNLVANEMFEKEGAKNNTIDEIIKGINYLSSISKNLVIVTNEIFSDGIDYDDETMKYIYYCAKINNELAKIANEVIEVVYSIPIYHKGGDSNVEFI